MDFKDRKKELAETTEVLGSGKFELLIVYGRRRVGKTELVLHASRDKKLLYFLATTENNLARFRSACIKFDADAANLVADYEVLFDFLKDRAQVVVIDEFQNMIKENEGIVSVFQAIVDTELKNSKLKLVLLGSSVSMMASKVLAYQSPLYGRRTASFKLKPVPFFNLHEFFPKASMEELVEIYGFADGIPQYLIKIEGNLWAWLETEASREKSFLRDEVDFLMRYEFDDPSTYKLILEAIANGKATVKEIKDFMRVQRTDLSPYLKNLLEVDFIKRVVPINEKPISRRGRYFLNDNFLKFWFRFIYPNISSLESGGFKSSAIKREYSAYLGGVFEDVARQFLAQTRFFPFTKIGKWWFKDHEMDLVAANEPEGELLFAECKWQDGVNAEKICKELAEKAAFFEWNADNQTSQGKGARKEVFAVFAKSFSKKINEFEDRKVHCFDLNDLKKAQTQ